MMAKSFRRHYDINNLTSRLQKGEGGKMTLEIVIDGKTDKTEKNYQEYVHDKRTRDGACVLCHAFVCNR